MATRGRRGSHYAAAGLFAGLASMASRWQRLRGWPTFVKYLRDPFSAPAIYGIRGISTRVLFVTTRSRRSTGADRRGGVVME